MPVSTKYVREHPEKEYVLDKKNCGWRGEVGTIEFSVTGKIIGMSLDVDHRNYFVSCTEDDITVKGNLGITGPNGEGVADNCELFYVGLDLNDAINADAIYDDIRSARESEAHADYGHKIFKVQAAIFFDTAEEVK